MSIINTSHFGMNMDMITKQSPQIKAISVFFFVLLACTLNLQAQEVKRVIQVKFTGAIPTMSFYYYDTAFIQNFIRFNNSETQDTVINKEVFLTEGQVLRYSWNLKEGGIRVKSFIVPSSLDTLKFEIDNDHNLYIKGGLNSFIEDSIDILYDDPRLYPQIESAFLDDERGPEAVHKIFNSNFLAIKEKLNNRTCSKLDYEILSIIARTDYYTRLLFWAQKNDRYIDIEKEMIKLAEEKELIQSVSSSSIVQIFGKYVGYIIYSDNLNPKNATNIIDAVIKLGWKKNITSEYFTNVLEDIPMENTVAIKCYEDLKKYFNGEYEEKLVRIARSILPKLVNTEKALLTTVEGKQLSFHDLLKNNPNKFLLIDFWASWCLPCREEAPFFESAKSDFLGKNIVFLSISLDEDNKVADWKKALKDDGLLNATNHYRLVMPTNNPLFKSFGVSNIPRYILINSKGEFIHPNFYMPSDPKFKESLAKIIAAEN